MITRSTVDSVNTNQFGQNMSEERNEHSVESEMEGIRNEYIYILALMFQKKRKKRKNKKKQKEKKKEKKWDSGTGTALTGTGTSNAKRGSALLVPIPH